MGIGPTGSDLTTLLLFAWLLVGCFDFGLDERGRRDSTPDPQQLWVAVGPAHSIPVGTPGCAGGSPTCFDADPSQLTSLDIDAADGLLIEVEVRSRKIMVDVNARQPGDATVRVAFEDVDGNQRTLELEVKARDIDHVAASPACEREWLDGPVVMAPGSELILNASALSKEGRGLYFGDLTLVETAPFDAEELPGGNLQRFRLTAPKEPGKYRLSLLDGGEVALWVFGAQELDLTLESADETHAGAALVLSRSLEGATLCADLESSPVWIEASGDDCELRLGDVRANGELPVLLSEGPMPLQLRGSGSCDVAARVDDAASVSLNVTLAAEEPSAPNPERILGPTPLATEPRLGSGGHHCDGGVTDGECEFFGFIPDGDCLTDADWEVSFVDHEGPLGRTPFVGVGLLTEVRMGVVVGPDSLQGHRAPLDVRWRYDDRLLFPGSAEDVDVEVLEGCHSGGESRSAVVTARGIGAHQIEFNADNLNDTLEVNFTAWRVDEVHMAALVGDTRLDEPDFLLFSGSSVQITGEFESTLNGRLRGLGSFHAVSDDEAGASVLDISGALHAGTAPQRITTGSPHGDGEQTIEVVDEQAVSSFDGLTGTRLQVGEQRCFELRPLDAQGRRIHGRLPRLPALALDSDAVVVLDNPSAGLCIAAHRPGTAHASLSLGATTWQGDFTVVAADGP